MVSNFPEPDVFTLNCPTQQVLDVLGNKWSTIVLYCLAYGPHRYGEVQRRIEGISQKVLTQTLRNLERHGLISRQAYPEVPPRVEYALTPLGASLIDPLQAIADWSRQHYAEVAASRSQYDRDRSPAS